ncbi:MAG TPA: serine hydrolase [Candidatus Dormibacteraeota bacterium]|nr:serine hydrolase [Candidatus Dormibacteraeota bacterium]
MNRGCLAAAIAVVSLVVLSPSANSVHATTTDARSSGLTLVAPSLAITSTTATQQLVLSLDHLVARSPMTLTAAIAPTVATSGATVGVALIELGGATPLVWSYNGHQVFTAASTYKLVALMMEAQNIAAGRTDPNGLVCYEDGDYEDGWYADYQAGACLSRNELAQRAGLVSDNTAGHMLVRDVGGADALNAWAASLGATDSDFFTDNSTSAHDLAVLWAAEAKGTLGGAAAQAWLYPVLTGTRVESGVPAGVAGRSTVVHKIGTIDLVDNDAALVTSGPNGPYVLVVMTDNLGGDAGWQLIASVSSAVWNFEAARAQ